MSESLYMKSNLRKRRFRKTQTADNSEQRGPVRTLMSTGTGQVKAGGETGQVGTRPGHLHWGRPLLSPGGAAESFHFFQEK